MQSTRMSTASDLLSSPDIDVSPIDNSSIDNKHEKRSITHSYKREGVSSEVRGSFLENIGYFSWATMSQAIGESLSLHLKTTLLSLPDVPSDDRVTTGFQMGYNLQNMILGTSVLSLPFCVKIAGIWGIILIFVIGCVACFTSTILTECQYQESFSKPAFQKRINISYVDMATACWKKAGRVVMEFIVFLSLTRSIVVIILLTDVSSDLLADIIGAKYDKKVLSIIWMMMFLPILFIKKVSLLTWLSFIGLNLYLLALLCVIVLCCSHAHKWHMKDLALTTTLQGFGISTGIIVNSFAVHMNMPILEGSLRNPKVYGRSVNITFFINIFTKMTFAVCGYLTYLGETGQEITSNIQQPYPLPILLKVAITFYSFFSVPLQSFVVFTLVDEKFRPHFPIMVGYNTVWLLISRLFFMWICLFIAVSIPHFSIVVSLIGSLRGSMICLILPSLFYIQICTHEKKLYKTVLCYIILVLGTIGAIVGVYASISAIIKIAREH